MRVCRNEEDILVEIPEEDLSELYKMYQKHVDWAPQACCAIDNAIKWREKTGDDTMLFLSPNNCWRKDGTFILQMTISSHANDFFVFTLDEECKHLYRGMMETKRINYSGESRVMLFGVSYKHYESMKKLAESKASAPIRIITTELFYIPIEKALQFEYSCPEDVYIDRLKTHDAFKIDEAWPHKYYGSPVAIEKLIKINGGLGIYFRSNDELVAWVLLGWVGQVALLQVVEEHKRNGYAAILTKALSKQIAKSNKVPHSTVVTKNAASLNLFKKLDFQSLGLAYYIVIPPNQ